MKEQYLGDVSDYRKYALLRALTTGSDLKLGVCWMLTQDDGRSDGNRLRYLDDPDKWRPYDPAVFDLLKRVVAQPESRRLDAIEHSGILGETVFFDRHVPDDLAGRNEYMAEAKRRLDGCDLVLFDPDNGLEVQSIRKGRKNSSKYLYLDEVAAYWAGGASLLIYQHYNRRSRPDLEEAVKKAVGHQTPGAHVSLFRTPHVVFILVAQPRHQPAFKRSLSRASTGWPECFISEVSPEPHPTNGVSSLSMVIVSQGIGESANGPKTKEVCEIKALDSRWKKTGIEDALRQRGRAQMRCIECHGEVSPHRAWRNGRNRAHFEHVQKHTGCSQSRSFTGIPTKHPLALK
jgi:hypothetical protein